MNTGHVLPTAHHTVKSLVISRHFSRLGHAYNGSLTSAGFAHIRHLSKHELNRVLYWAAQEGWNPGKYETGPLFALGSQAFYLLEIDGKSVGSITRIHYSPTYAFMGMLIVQREFRGKGPGIFLFETTVNQAPANMTLGLNAVINATALYKKFHFKPAFIIQRWGIIKEQSKLCLAHSDRFNLTTDFALDDLIAYDTSVFGFNRSAFLSSWIHMREAHTLVAYQNNRIVGYAVLSQTVKGYKVAPLFADTPDIAHSLLQCLLSHVPEGNEVFFDLPENNPNAFALLKEFKCHHVMDVLRMYRGEPGPFDAKYTYSVTSLEVG